MRYLIVGGTSVFGESLVKRLVAKESTEEIVITKLPGERSYAYERLTWRELDLRDVSMTNEIVKKAEADVIFDFATLDSVGESWLKPAETVDVNVVGTINLLNAIREQRGRKNPRIVIGGSGEEYGRVTFSELPIGEDTQARPVNIYGATKACQTMFAKLYVRAYGLDIVVLRTFNETSTKQDDRFAIASFCHQFVKMEKGLQEPILYAGNINNIRDFTDVRDLARAFELVAEKGKTGEIYNAARGKGTSLRMIIDMLQKITGITVKIMMDRSRVRPIDLPAIVADVQKIYRDTGWKAEIPMEQTLEEMLMKWRHI